MPAILLLGATGYVGGAVLVELKKVFPDYQIKAPVRNALQNEAVLAAGASEVINTSNQEHVKIEALSEASDIVINAADADDLPLTEAILRGMKRRYDSGKGVSILLHTSGTGVFLDGSVKGSFDPAGHVFTDETEDDIRAITVNNVHGHVDVPILTAGEAGYVRTYIIAPGAIAGRGSGPVGKAGALKFFAPLTMQWKSPWYVGEGTAVFPAVHIDDLASLYILVLKQALADKSLAQPRESAFARYYIAAVNNVTWKDVTRAFSEVLLKAGLIETLAPKSITVDEAGALGPYLAGNCHVQPFRASRLGWEARPVTMAMFAENAEEAIKRE